VSAFKHSSFPQCAWISLKVFRSAMEHLGQPQRILISHGTLMSASRKVPGSAMTDPSVPWLTKYLEANLNVLRKTQKP
jgi:hypothetical protein